MTTSRKYIGKVSPNKRYEARDIFEIISGRHGVHYVCLYKDDDYIFVGVHMKNVILKERLMSILSYNDVFIDSMIKCKKFGNTVLSEYGTRFINGGYRKSTMTSLAPVTNTRGRKFCVYVSSIPSDSEGLFREISEISSLHYLGVYQTNDSFRIYVHSKNMISSNNLEKRIRSLGIEFESLCVCIAFEGDVLSEHGVKLSRGGYRSRKTKPTTPSPPLASSSSSTPPLSKKSRKESLTPLPENIYLNRTVNPLDPKSFDESDDCFHAIWSSTETGLWYPAMWVGPSRNIVASKRTSIKEGVINDLMSDQDRECRLCDSLVYMGTYSNSDVDHIIPLKHGGKSNPSNLQILCVTCHRRKTALECKKLVTMMGDSNIDWKDKIYLTNTHVHYEPRTVPKTNPKDFLVENGSSPGLFVLEY